MVARFGGGGGSWLGWLVLLAPLGCATTPYQFGRFHPDQPDGVALQPIVIERGGNYPTLDRIGRIVGFPARLLTLNKKVNNHDISPETLDKLLLYLEQNDLTDVYVAVNQYSPRDQWRRLQENDHISPVWRYSVGTLTWLGYTLFPSRVFGGDRYNPFTNSLILSSDVPAMVLAEAAYAKDIHSQRLPGTYAAIFNDLPVLSVWRQSKAVCDVLSYARLQADWPLEKQTYQVLYPHLGAGLVGPVGPLVQPYGPFISLGGVLAGHVTGRTVAALLEPKALPIETTPCSAQESKAGSCSSESCLSAGKCCAAPALTVTTSATGEPPP